MDKEGEKRAPIKRSSDTTTKVDRLSNLPEALLFKVLLNLPTRDVVRSSVLSSRWKHIWRFVPGLDLRMAYFPDQDAYVSFVDRFFDFNPESCIQSLKLRRDDSERDSAHVTSWIHNVVKRKIQHLNVINCNWRDDEVHIPPTVYKCQSLVSLKLYNVNLTKMTAFVSLPSLREIDMQCVKFDNNLGFEKLISGCPALESFAINRRSSDNLNVLRVCSKSLLSFTHVVHSHQWLDENQEVVIDAPKLKYLRLNDVQTARLIKNNQMSIVEVHISIMSNLCFPSISIPNAQQKREMICNFLDGISCVKDMTIYSHTLEVIYFYLTQKALPQFSNLVYMRTGFSYFSWEMFHDFLDNCPNLKSLVVGYECFQEGQEVSIISTPQCLISSLEFVEIERPIKGDALEMNLVSYFLKNSKLLKKMTLRLDGRSKQREKTSILKKLNAIPKLSRTCQVVVG